MTENIKISAIVPTYNRGNMVVDTLRSLKSQTLPDNEYEIIVIINGSTDNTQQIIDSINREGGKEISYLSFKENVGLHNARHAGAKASRGKILAYTDDDAICDRNWLAALLNGYLSDEVACVGGKILPRWESPPPGWMRHFDPWTLSLLDYGEQRKDLKWPQNIFGCNFSVWKYILYQFGGFNPEYVGDKWVGDGEAGLLRRIHSAGLKVVYVPDAVVWHIIPDNRASLAGMKKRFANYGVSHSCVSYKIKKHRRLKLLLRSGFFFLNYCKHSILGIWKSLLKRDLFYLYQALRSYFKSRGIYELKLVFDKKLIALVNREDWINEP